MISLDVHCRRYAAWCPVGDLRPLYRKSSISSSPRKYARLAHTLASHAHPSKREMKNKGHIPKYQGPIFNPALRIKDTLPGIRNER